MLPWSQNQERTAFVFCDVLDRNYRPFEGDPRWVLRRQLERARALGLEFYVGPELEYFYFKSAAAPELTDDGGYFSVLPADLGNDLRKQTMRTLDKLGHPDGGLAPRGRARRSTRSTRTTTRPCSWPTAS